MSRIFRTTPTTGVPVNLVREIDDATGQKWFGFGVSGRVRIPSDPAVPIGSCALSLTNLVIGSNIQLERSGTGLEFRQATSSTEVFTIPVYSSGNDVFIKVRKASSSPYYRSYETQMTATVGSSSIYVNQIPDE